MIIIKKKITKLKNFSIGKSNAKASFRNVKRIKKENMLVYYSVDVYGKKGLKNKDLLIQVNNKEKLHDFLGEMYPYNVRKNLM